MTPLKISRYRNRGNCLFGIEMNPCFTTIVTATNRWREGTKTTQRPGRFQRAASNIRFPTVTHETKNPRGRDARSNTNQGKNNSWLSHWIEEKFDSIRCDSPAAFEEGRPWDQLSSANRQSDETCDRRTWLVPIATTARDGNAADPDESSSTW